MILVQVMHFVPKLGALRASVGRMVGGGSVGSSVGAAEAAAAQTCAICYSPFTHPVRLACRVSLPCRRVPIAVSSFG